MDLCTLGISMIGQDQSNSSQNKSSIVNCTGDSIPGGDEGTGLKPTHHNVQRTVNNKNHTPTSLLDGCCCTQNQNT